MTANRIVPGLIEIRESVLVADVESKFSSHEFPRSDWLTMIALPVVDNNWLNA